MSLEKRIEELTLAVTNLTIAIGEMSKDLNVDLNPYEKALADKQAREEEDNTLVAVTPSDIEEVPTPDKRPKSVEEAYAALREEIPMFCKDIMDKNRDDKPKVQQAFASFNGAKSLSQIPDKELTTLLSKLVTIKKEQK
jgi:hypothetical protein